MDIINVIDKIETLVQQSRGTPFGGAKLVDERKMMELLDQLRLAVPQDVKAAQELLQRKDSLLQQAQLEARRTKSQADEQFRSRLEESEVVAAATTRAEEVVQEAQRRAVRLLEQAERDSRAQRAEADAYALQVLRNLERELSGVLGSVKKGVQVLVPQSDEAEKAARR